MGRHFNFRLRPFTVREMEKPNVLPPDKLLTALFGKPVKKAFHAVILMQFIEGTIRRPSFVEKPLVDRCRNVACICCYACTDSR
jgi:hypothetical protein